MILARHALRLVLREPRRTLAALVGIAIAAALLSSVLLFGAASGATMTRRALSGVPVDFQVELAQGADAAAAAALVSADPAVSAASRADLAAFDGAVSTRAGSATQTGAGLLVGVDPSYTARTGLFGLSSGTLPPGGVAISRDLASNLGAVAGDSIAFSLPGGGTVTLVVSGIVSTAGADLVLGPTDAAHRAAGANPPTNVAVMSLADLETRVLPLIPAGATASDPSLTGGAGSASAGTGASAPVASPVAAVRRELHVRLDHAQLPGDPVGAQAWLDTVRRRLEAKAAGAFTVVDDAGDSLTAVAGDLAWGQVLFIFLALPGVALALALSPLAADATADATRRHAALLRARGARRRDLALVFGAASLLTALAGSAVGALLGGLAGALLLAGQFAGADPAGAVAGAVAGSVVATTLLAGAVGLVPLRRQLTEEIAAERHELRRASAPRWERLYLDVLAIAGGVAAWFLAGGGGIHPVLTTEGNPTVTLAVSAFLSPLLFWLGGTLLLLRIAGAMMRRGAGLRHLLERLLGVGGSVAARSLAARTSAAARAIAILALSVGFATSVLVFNATYVQQQRVDAALTLGADVKATPTGAATASSAGTAAGPGVAAATPFVDRVVYVGPEAQDLLAVDPRSLPSVSPLADSFFSGQTASAAIAALRASPDAILVSAETAKDYSLVPGDQVRIRVPDASGRLVTVAFRMAGVALEFPTAPKDAFLVANLSYVAAQTGNDRISYLLARGSGDPGAASAAVASRLGPGWAVEDLGTTTARLANSITSVDLGALVAIDVAFALLIAGVGVGLFLLAGLAERRRQIATLVAVGAGPGHLRRLVVGEAAVVAVAGVASGLLTGGLVALGLLQILAGLFDPPAQVPAMPLAPLVASLGAVGAAVAVAVAVADRGAARLGVVAALRER